MPPRLHPEVVLDRENSVLELYQQGKSTKEIAKLLGEEFDLSIASIADTIKSLRKQGRIRGKKCDITHEKIADLIAKGLTAKEIAVALDITTDTIYKVGKTRNLKITRGKGAHRYSPQYEKSENSNNINWAKILRELIHTPDTLKSIGNRLGISAQRVHAILKMAKVNDIPVHAVRYAENGQELKEQSLGPSRSF